jgi:deazaflavin-dependent oxidoreductase (nitroreductase family)
MGTTEQAPPYARRARRRARLMRIANVPMRRLLSLPFETPIGRRLMLLTLTGRKTGRIYRQPVSYVEDDGVLLTPGGGRWKRNLVEGRPVSVRLRGRAVLATPELVGDPDEVDRLLRRMMSRNPRLSSFVPFIGQDRRIDPDRLRTAIDYGFRIVRWHVTSPERPAA